MSLTLEALEQFVSSLASSPELWSHHVRHSRVGPDGVLERQSLPFETELGARAAVG